MYDIIPNLVFGFHGCDQTTCNTLLNNPDRIKISQGPFEWLGHGMYFWENNYERAWDWARAKCKKGKINKPAVIGAVLDLGYCYDFLNTKHIEMFRLSYRKTCDFYERLGMPLPKNKDVPQDKHKNKLLRELDCAVIEYMNASIADQIEEDLNIQGFSEQRLPDSVRGAFVEGGPIFDGSGIYEKTHIQICIRNPKCIIGFFLPRAENIPLDFEYDNNDVSDDRFLISGP